MSQFVRLNTKRTDLFFLHYENGESETLVDYAPAKSDMSHI